MERLRRVIFALVVFAVSVPVLAIQLPSTPPPDPGDPGMATLDGIDSNNNLIRDDLERYILAQYPEPIVRQYVAHLAVYYQAILKYSANRAVTNELHGYIRAVSDCFEPIAMNASDARGNLLPELLNTYDRSVAYADVYDDSDPNNFPRKTLDCAALSQSASVPILPPEMPLVIYAASTMTGYPVGYFIPAISWTIRFPRSYTYTLEHGEANSISSNLSPCDFQQGWSVIYQGNELIFSVPTSLYSIASANGYCYRVRECSPHFGGMCSAWKTTTNRTMLDFYVPPPGTSPRTRFK